MKRLVFCFDGTGNTLDRPHATNVAITASAVKNLHRGVSQIVYYDEGVGTGGWKDKLVGGATGEGLFQRVVEGYKFLVFNYEPGDEIFIFGFSRGAYTARSFAGLLQHVGVVNSCFADKIHVAASLYQQREKKAAIEELDEINRFRAEFSPDLCASEQDRDWRAKFQDAAGAPDLPVLKIKYIGVWDTVKTLGDPMLGDDDRDGEYDAAEFHDHRLHASVEAARHAVAIDERRKKFDVTPWDNIDELNAAREVSPDDPERPYQQQWFPGDHGSVGGGGEIRGLSDEALEWVWAGAKRQGLGLDISPHSKVWGIRPDVLSPTSNSNPEKKSWDLASVVMRNLPKGDRDGPIAMHEISKAALVRWAAPEGQNLARWRPKPLDRLRRDMDEQTAGYEPWEFIARGGFEAEGDYPAAVDGRGQPLRRYTIRAGTRSLADIAAQELGDPGRTAEILALNRTTILDPDRFYAGQVINLPNV
ncbi:phospholipase effector Tle1 domain-containing protein [Brevundimonas sp.]|uniref:phospholipase effector Tle1 domain-containing protein n=1 Tax=Brevundimonas sp. TaxID=1871086 RepID=UPI0035B049D0